MFKRKCKHGPVYYATAQYQGRQYTERVGTEKRECLRRERQIKREIRQGTFKPAERTGAVTAGRYAREWGERRTNRTATDDRQRLRARAKCPSTLSWPLPCDAGRTKPCVPASSETLPSC